MFIEEGTDHTTDGSHIHNARNSQIQITGFLGHDLTGTSEQQRNALHNGSWNKRK